MKDTKKLTRKILQQGAFLSMPALTATSGRDSGIDDAETVIERNIDDEARTSQSEEMEKEEEEDELCQLCPCWGFCPGIPHNPPKMEEKTALEVLKFIGSIVSFF